MIGPEQLIFRMREGNVSTATMSTTEKLSHTLTKSTEENWKIKRNERATVRHNPIPVSTLNIVHNVAKTSIHNEVICKRYMYAAECGSK